MPPRRRKKPVRSVDRSDPDFSLEAVIDTMKLEHIQCRDFAHAWRPYTARRMITGGFEQTLRCSRCYTRRIRELDRRGGVVHSGYDYADGYVIKGLGRVTGSEKDHLRLKSILATLVEDTAAEGG